MTQNAAQLSGAIFLGSESSSSACFTVRRVTPYDLEEVQHERVPECLLNWDKDVNNVRGDSLHEFPLLL